MARITHTDGAFSGSIGQVQFKDGLAVTEDHTVIAYAVLAGHKVEQDEPAPTDDLDGRKPAELKAYAEEHGVDLAGATRKPAILAAIRAHFAALPDSPEPEADPDEYDDSPEPDDTPDD